MSGRQVSTAFGVNLTESALPPTLTAELDMGVGPYLHAERAERPCNRGRHRTWWDGFGVTSTRMEIGQLDSRASAVGLTHNTSIFYLAAIRFICLVN
jgi:hypothetical protein